MEILGKSFEDRGPEEIEHPHSFEELTDNPDDFIENIIESFDEQIGEGNSAEVYIDQSFPDICFKVLVRGNDVHSPSDEAELMTQAREVLPEDVHIPTPLFVISAEVQSEDGGQRNLKILGMERVFGATLEELMLGKKPYPGETQPNDINDLKAYRELQRKMVEAVRKMNEEHLLFHKDLKPRNIMIDNDRQSWIIDFGRSSKGHFRDEDAGMHNDAEDAMKSWNNFLLKAKGDID